MPFNEQLASAVREELASQRGLVEKKMFGGVAFLINGNMSVGVHKNELIVRLPPEETAEALKETGARIFDRCEGIGALGVQSGKCTLLLDRTLTRRAAAEVAIHLCELRSSAPGRPAFS